MMHIKLPENRRMLLSSAVTEKKEKSKTNYWNLASTTHILSFFRIFVAKRKLLRRSSTSLLLHLTLTT